MSFRWISHSINWSPVPTTFHTRVVSRLLTGSVLYKSPQVTLLPIPVIVPCCKISHYSFSCSCVSDFSILNVIKGLLLRSELGKLCKRTLGLLWTMSPEKRKVNMVPTGLSLWWALWTSGELLPVSSVTSPLGGTTPFVRFCCQWTSFHWFVIGVTIRTFTLVLKRTFVTVGKGRGRRVVPFTFFVAFWLSWKVSPVVYHRWIFGCRNGGGVHCLTWTSRDFSVRCFITVINWIEFVDFFGVNVLCLK